MKMRIYLVAIEVARMMVPVLEEIERRDRDLARQTRRAVPSVALNIAEGSGSQGGNRRARYFNALGSAREVSACLEVAEVMGYMTAKPEIEARLKYISCSLRKIVQ